MRGARPRGDELARAAPAGTVVAAGRHTGRGSLRNHRRLYPAARVARPAARPARRRLRRLSLDAQGARRSLPADERRVSQA